MDVVLHIGAHRTGSTMVPQSVTIPITVQLNCGVALWCQHYLREIPEFHTMTQLFDNDMCPIDEKAANRLDKMISFIDFEVSQKSARGIHTLIFSEESFIGGMCNNSETGEFYPDVTFPFSVLDSLLPISPVRVAFGVREYGAVCTFAFHYQPQLGREVPDFERARSTLLNKKRGWPEVVNAASTVWSGVKFLMWQQKHLVVSSWQMCAQIMVFSADKIVISSEKVNARKSTTARPIIFLSKERKTLPNRYNHYLRRTQSDERSQWMGGAI